MLCLEIIYLTPVENKNKALRIKNKKKAKLKALFVYVCQLLIAYIFLLHNINKFICVLTTDSAVFMMMIVEKIANKIRRED